LLQVVVRFFSAGSKDLLFSLIFLTVAAVALLALTVSSFLDPLWSAALVPIRMLLVMVVVLFNIGLQVYIYAHTHTYIHIYIYIYIYIELLGPAMERRAGADTDAARDGGGNLQHWAIGDHLSFYIYIHTHTHICIYIYMYVYIYKKRDGHL